MSTNVPSLDTVQLEKAATALRRYVGAHSGDKLLDDDDDFLYLLFSLKRSHPEHKKDKPISVLLPNPIYKFEDTDICLFVKDSRSGDGHKAAKKRLAALQGRAGISKVIGTSKLRTKYESFEAKRNLCQAHDLFLADDRILPSLPKLLGKSFFKKKKQPIPIKLTKKDVESQVRAAAESTSVIISGGSCLSVKVARVSFNPEAVVANVIVVAEAVARSIPKKWDNIQSLFLKTADSVALPVYQSLPIQAQKL